MRKVFLDELPKQNRYNGKRVDWNKSIGCKVKFVYDDIEGEVEIIGYDKNKLSLKYNGKTDYIRTYEFKQCRLAYIIGLKFKSYKYNINEIIKTNNGEIKIINQLRISKYKIKNTKATEKSYRYKCLKCGNIDIISENHIKEGIGCPVCCNKKIIKGVNDLATTNPELIKYFINIEDCYKYSRGSKKKVAMHCPICGFKKEIQIDTLSRQGFGCNQCSDGISYPNKFIANILSQLCNCDFETEKTFDWSNNKRYDFYIKNLDCLLEVQGGQHYDGGFSRANGRTLEQEQENDKLKLKLAKNKIKYYIIINARKSELEWIKNSVLKSKLNELFDLSNIDWIKCHEYACSSLIKKVCDLWNNGIHNTQEIVKIVGISRSTVINNLKKGNKIGWCDYNPKEELQKGLYKATQISKKNNKVKVICLNNEKIFDSILEASKSIGLKSSSSIQSCCKRRNKSAGKHPTTGEPLKWMYYEDYLKLHNNELNQVS